MKKIFVLIVLALFSLSINAQPSIEINSIDTQFFPLIRAEITSKDAQGKEIRSYQASDLKVMDGGKERAVLNPTCDASIKKFSLILTIDVSASMFDKIEEGNSNSAFRGVVMKSSIQAFLNNLPIDRLECAITKFSASSNSPNLVHDFTKNVDTLKKLVNNLGYSGGTNYISAFLGSKNGNKTGSNLEVARRAKWKPVIIFFTDGEHLNDDNMGTLLSNTPAILDLAEEVGATIYYVGLGVNIQNSNDPASQRSYDFISSLTSSTNGGIYNNVTSEDDVEKVFSDILSKIQQVADPAPCSIEWISDCDGGNVEISNTVLNVSDTDTYVLPDNLIPKMEIATPLVENINIAKNANKTTQVIITARQNTVIVDGASTGNPQYKVTAYSKPTPITLKKDESATLTLTYTPTDSTFLDSKLILNTTACSGNESQLQGEYIFTKYIDCGGSTKDVKISTSHTQKFCNYTDREIQITSFSVANSVPNEFVITTIPQKVPANSCIDINVDFTPKDADARTAVYTVRTTEGDFSANLYGQGSGKPNIQVAGHTFKDLLCNETDDYEIEIKNTGAVALDISSIDLTNKTDFEIVNNPNTLNIGPGLSAKITARFNPQSVGTKNTDLTFLSNAETEPTKVVTLTGKRLFVKVEVVDSVFDFGIVCPNSLTKKAMKIKNLSDVEIDYTLEITKGQSQYKIPNTSGSIKFGESADVQLEFSDAQEGTFEGTIVISSKCIAYLVPITGIVSKATATGPDQSFTAIVGTEDTKTFEITNPSKHTITFDASIANTEFTIISPANPTNLTLNAGGKMNFTVKFNPTNPNIQNAQLVLSGNPCSFTTNINLIGSPTLANATLVIGNASALVGSKVDIPVRLINKNYLFESGGVTVNAQISYDNRLLKPSFAVTPVVNGNRSTIPMQFAIANNNNDQTYATNTLQFDVLNTNDADFSDLKIENASTNNLAATINKIDGRFDVIIPNVEANIIDISGKPGDLVDFPLQLIDNADVLSNFHQGVKSKLRFNASMITPVPLVGSFDSNTNEWVIDIDKNMNFSEAKKDSKDGKTQAGKTVTIETLKLKVLLGNSETAKIYFENLSVKNGKVTISSDSANITLLNVCKNSDGTLRFVDPFSNVALALKINPTPINQNSVNAQIDILEEGNHSIYLISETGYKIPLESSKFYAAGTHERLLNFENVANGVYFIVIESPSQSQSSKVIIQK